MWIIIKPRLPSVCSLKNFLRGELDTSSSSPTPGCICQCAWLETNTHLGAQSHWKSPSPILRSTQCCTFLLQPRQPIHSSSSALTPLPHPLLHPSSQLMTWAFSFTESVKLKSAEDNFDKIPSPLPLPCVWASSLALPSGPLWAPPHPRPYVYILAQPHSFLQESSLSCNHFPLYWVFPISIQMSSYSSYITRTKAKTQTCFDPISRQATTLFLVLEKLLLRTDNANCLQSLSPILSWTHPIVPLHSLVKVTNELHVAQSSGSFLI